MFTIKTAVTALAFVASAQAFVAALYDDDSCQNQIGERNVYDNTCAELGDTAIGSYKITTWGSSGQYARSYGEDNCADFGGVGQTSCEGAGPPGGGLGNCVSATVPGSRSHALGSSADVCN